jgi:hypothetical protein
MSLMAVGVAAQTGVDTFLMSRGSHQGHSSGVRACKARSRAPDERTSADLVGTHAPTGGGRTVSNVRPSLMSGHGA